MFRISDISYGGTAAIVTSMALVVGLEAAHATKNAIVSALLIAALADNLVDSLSIHVYQESEKLDRKSALIGTIKNFIARLALCLSFVVIVVIVPPTIVTTVVVAWGTLLLAVLTYLISNKRGEAVLPEIIRHIFVAALVILLSRFIGGWISARLLG